MQNNHTMVLVGSLERHLENERKIVYEAIVGLNAIPVGLSFPFMPANYLLKLNLQCLNDADYLFLLVGKEYGPITEKGISNLHQVYASAKAMRKAVVSFVYNGDINVDGDLFDQKRRQGFVDTLQSDTVFNWSTNDELRDCVERGLEFIQEKTPSVGWVKSDSLPRVHHDEESSNNDLVSKLKSQIVYLKARIDKVANGSSSLAVGFDFNSEPWLVRFSCNAFREGRLKQFSSELKFDMKDVFDWLSAALLTPVSELRLQSILAAEMNQAVLSSVKAQWIGCHAVSDLKIEQSSIDSLKKRLRSLGVIEFDDNARWRLTATAEKRLLELETAR